MSDKYLVKYSTWLMAAGYYHAILLDIHNHRSIRIPKDVFRFLKFADKKPIGKIISLFHDESTVNEYISFLIKEGVCFLSNKTDVSKMRNMSMFWDYPALISNSIIDISKENLGDLIVFFDKFSFQNTNIQFRFLQDSVTADEIIQMIQKVIQRKIEYLEFYFDSKNEKSVLNYLLSTDRGKSSIIVKIFNSVEKKMFMYDNMNVIKTDCKILELQCGTFVFNENGEHFCESQKYNTCLNRKLCIDQDGYIKNCPSMKHHYGHISNTNVEEVVNLPEFQKWWHIKKDEIDVCKDCEFRHMCTDCRAFIKDPENIYSQPAKCTYNPYICKWEGEEGYVPVEECGSYSRETGFVPDKKKIKKLNKQIWGDD